MANTSVVEFKKVVKWFGNRGALHGLDFSASRNEIHGYLGHNGAGKTTSFLIANRLMKPDFGDISLFGVDINHLTRKEMIKVSLLTDKLIWYRDLTVKELLEFGCGIYGKKYQDVMKTEVIRLFEPEPWLKKPLKTLSTGMTKKVSIMMCLIPEPELVFLDEPFSGLDPIAMAEISGLIRHLRDSKGMTFVISSHNLPETEAICDRITIIKSGCRVATGTMDELHRKFALNRSFLLKYRSGNREFSVEAADEAILHSEMNRVREKSGQLVSITENKISLSDVYQKIHS